MELQSGVKIAAHSLISTPLPKVLKSMEHKVLFEINTTNIIDKFAMAQPRK